MCSCIEDIVQLLFDLLSSSLTKIASGFKYSMPKAKIARPQVQTGEVPRI